MAIITFTDADGVEQTLDTEQKFNVAYHVDCRVLMQALPDKCFDLCCTDPPYGDGLPQDDNSQSVNVERERERETGITGQTRTGEERQTAGRNVGICQVAASGTASGRDSTDTRRQPLRFHGGDRWNKYLPAEATLCQPGGGTVSSSTETVARTGGTWAEKYGKKS